MPLVHLAALVWDGSTSHRERFLNSDSKRWERPQLMTFEPGDDQRRRFNGLNYVDSPPGEAECFLNSSMHGDRRTRKGRAFIPEE